MKRFFHSVQVRITLILILCLTLSFFSFWFSMRYLSDGITKSQREEKLIFAAAVLDYALGDRTYDSILNELGAQDAPREKQIVLLNGVLAETCDQIAALHPGLGIGYYSRELDAILTYAPSAEYGNMVGVSLAEDHPGRVVMMENKPMVRVGTMVRGDIMNAMHPIRRHGAVIGYAWANELSSQISSQFLAFSNQILLFMGAFYVLALIFAVFLSRRSLRGIREIVSGVGTLRFDLGYRLPKAEGDLGDITDSINSMAEDIVKAQDERKALLLAEAANVAQRDFISRMSHELRTPMNGVLGMTQLAQTAPTEEARMDYLSKIHSSASLLLGVINDILDFSKIEAGKIELVHVNFNLEMLLDNLHSIFSVLCSEKNLELRYLPARDLPLMAHGDENRIRQILTNLLSNALKYTPQGQVTFSARLEDGQTLRFDIEDTGIGIREEDQQKLFKPFEQLDTRKNRNVVGTGLGLAISYNLCRIMGGDLWMESEYGKGSRFSVCIPYVGDTQAGADHLEQLVEIQDFVAPQAKILVVDDIEINLAVAEAMLSAFDIRPDLATSGAEAIELAKNNPYHIIFMDHMMPEMDGLETTWRIRSLSPHNSRVPIVALTANVISGMEQMFLDNRMDDFLPKPISITALNLCLRKWLPPDMMQLV